jgi:hypothetical protein
VYNIRKFCFHSTLSIINNYISIFIYNMPLVCQKSNQRCIFSPFPTSNFKNCFAISLILRSFLQHQEQFWGIPILQKLFCLRKLFLIQATRKELDLAKILHMCLCIEVLFQTSSLFNPKPPSFLGTRISDQATLAFATFTSFPFHKNLLNFCSIVFIICLGRIKYMSNKLAGYTKQKKQIEVFLHKIGS